MEVYACAECGFEQDLASAETVPTAIVDGVGDVVALVAGAGPAVHGRRAPGVWSPLEYACHLRDALLVQRERVLMARRIEQPVFDPMGRDERVDHDGYADQNPDDVTRQLADAAAMFANVLRRLGSADWDRTVVYGYPERRVRSLRWVAAHTLHEVRHHRRDIEDQLANEDG